MNYSNIAELSKTCPDLSVTLKLGELLSGIEFCISETKKGLEQIIQDESQEKYLSPKKTAELLDINLSTLWRHNKRNYLNPIEIGGKRRYKLSDINRILKAEV
jgi:hypothetical protein